MSARHSRPGSIGLTGRIIAYVLPLLAADCSHRAEDCRYTLTCGDFPATGGSSDAGLVGGTTSTSASSPTGGTSAAADSSSMGGIGVGGTLGTGGTDAVDGTGGVLATGGAPTCEPACDGDKSICMHPELTCVECMSDEHCIDKVNRRYCDTTIKTCVECLDNEDCTSASASACIAGKCSPCQSKDDCAHIDDRNVCRIGADADAGVEVGTCVECTGNDYEACRDGDAGRSRVCDSLANACSKQLERSAGLCQPCVSDAQCESGAVCAEQLFDGKSVGYFCFVREGAPGRTKDCTFSSNRPFVKPLDTTSIDGIVGTVCSLAVSSCTALNDFRQTSCASTANTPDDTLCGFAPGVDSRCVAYGSTQYRCTVTCWSDDDCLPSAACDKGATPRVCSIL